MSASHRKLARLPLEIFDNLHLRVSSGISPEDLRTQICNRLKRFPLVRRGTTTTASIKTVGDLLRANKRTLVIALDPLLTFAELELWIQRICQVCSAKSTSAWALLESTNDSLPLSQSSLLPLSSFGDRLRYLPTGLPSLDAKLQGGIRVGSVTEIVGRAGAGKTQLAFQLCLLAAKYNQASMYIDTERKISLERLTEMSQHRYGQDTSNNTNNVDHEGAMLFSYSDGNETNSQQQQQQQPVQANQSNPRNDNIPGGSQQATYFSFKSPEEVLANLIVKTPSSTEELIQTLDAAEETILQRNLVGQNPVRLLIVDSIAAPLKRDFGSDAFMARSAAIFKCAQTLRRLAETLHLAILVINQVGAALSEKSPHAVQAALGTSWHHCVSTRLVLDQCEVDTIQENEHNTQEGWTDFGNLALAKRRTVDIAKSNIVPHATTQFEICNAGIVDPQTNSI